MSEYNLVKLKFLLVNFLARKFIGVEKKSLTCPLPLAAAVFFFNGKIYERSSKYSVKNV